MHRLSRIVSCLLIFALLGTLNIASAQSISVGRGGLSVRGSNGGGIRFGRSGVYVQQPVVVQTPALQAPVPNQHGVRIQQGRPTNLPYASHPATASRNGLRNRPTSSQSGNFIVANAKASPFQAAAEIAFRTGELHYAMQSSAMALKQDPQNGLLHLFASHLYFAIGDFQTSLKALNVATSSLPPDQWGLIVRNIHVFDNSRNLDRQIAALEQHIDDRPDSAEARVLYGFYQGMSGRRRVAADQFLIALKAVPNHPLAVRLSDQLVKSRTITRRTSVSSHNVANPHYHGTEVVVPNHQSVLITTPNHRKAEHLPSIDTPTSAAVIDLAPAD